MLTATPGMTREPAASTTGTRLPRVVYVLAAGTFLLGTTEFMIAGLLPEISCAMRISDARAGLLITVFAVGMIVGAPVMALATRRVPPRVTLVASLGVFAAGHGLAALSHGFVLLLGARFVTALATGAFWSVAAVVATRAAGPSARARALAVVMGGLTLANVIGVPAGALAGHLVGWRGPFWALAGLSAAAAMVIGRLVPGADGDGEPPPVSGEFAALRQVRVWLALAACALIMGGVIGTYTYISPLLSDRAGIGPGAVALVLVGFGAGALAGTVLGGGLGDRYPLATAIVASAGTAVVLALLALLSRDPAMAIVLVTLMGLTGFAVNPVVTSLAVRFAVDAPTLTSALSVSWFNIGNAGGSALAGLTLGTSLREIGPPALGAAISALTLVPLVALAVIGTRSAEPVRRAPRTQEAPEDTAVTHHARPVNRPDERHPAHERTVHARQGTLRRAAHVRRLRPGPRQLHRRDPLR